MRSYWRNRCGSGSERWRTCPRTTDRLSRRPTPPAEASSQEEISSQVVPVRLAALHADGIFIGTRRCRRRSAPPPPWVIGCRET